MGNSPCRRNYKVSNQRKETVESGLESTNEVPVGCLVRWVRNSPDIPPNYKGGYYLIILLLGPLLTLERQKVLT